MENFILTVSFLLIGMGLRRLPRFPRETAQVLNLFVTHVSLPALVLFTVPKIVFSPDLVVLLLMPWAMLAVSAGIVLVAAKKCGWPRDTAGALLLLVPLGNTSFLGIPMVRAFFGEPAIAYAVLYDQAGSFLALATYGSMIIALYGGGEKPAPAAVLRKVLTFPPFLALLLALALRSLPLPSPLTALFAALAATLVPTVMIAVGFQLSLRLSPEVMRPLAFGVSVKLALAPLLALAACRLLGLDSLAARVAVFEAGMPAMVSAGALAIMAGLAPQLTAALVGLGILLSFLTLPLLFQTINLFL